MKPGYRSNGPSNDPWIQCQMNALPSNENCDLHTENCLSNLLFKLPVYFKSVVFEHLNTCKTWSVHTWDTHVSNGSVAPKKIFKEIKILFCVCQGTRVWCKLRANFPVPASYVAIGCLGWDYRCELPHPSSDLGSRNWIRVPRGMWQMLLPAKPSCPPRSWHSLKGYLLWFEYEVVPQRAHAVKVCFQRQQCSEVWPWGVTES